MPLAQINGNRLYFEDSGSSGPAIVFSHGGFVDHAMWEHQLAGLSSDAREMSEMVAGNRGVAVIEGGPHCSALTHPDMVNGALRGFMQAL
jgi:pimeloyl-ACP methyl ester carboxylesterase